MSEEGQGNVEVYDQPQADFDDIVLRRSDPDDFEQIINLVEFDDIYNRFYSFPKILKLIETAYLSITVLNQEGHIIAFATFEDYPQGMKGTYDDLHYNHWEAWFNEAYQLNEFNSANTLWMSYFITAQSIQQEDQGTIFQKVLQTVYTSLPEVLGILFLMKGDAEEEDVQHCFGPIGEYFEEIACKSREVLKQVRGVHYNSKIWFSSRLLVLPYVKIRQAQQEDHDDLAAVFNSQSYTVTEIYGDYFLAELIAAQDETNKALVAQVKDKAIGLMGFTSDVDVNLLHKCFELESYDNLFKPEFMDAINKRREHIISQHKNEDAKLREQELKRLKEETMRCNIIAQRISFQEYCIDRETDIKEKIENMLKNEEDIKLLKRDQVEEIFDEWFSKFTLSQPSEYFFDNPTDDSDLCTNIQTKQEFALSVLEIFGLPAGYMEGKGHFSDWGKEKNEKSVKSIMRNMKMKKKKKPKGVQKIINQKKEREKQVKVKPTHFDLEPFLKAFKDFVALNSEVRSKIRIEIKKESDVIDSIFVDEYGERSFKKCVDIMSLEKLLANRNVALHQQQAGTIRRQLKCFCNISYILKEVIKMPDKDPKEVAKELARKKAEEEAKVKEKEEKDPSKRKRAPTMDEDTDEVKKKAPPRPINVKLYETSIHDMYQALEKMQDYDFTLSALGVVKGSLDEEKMKEGIAIRDEEDSDINITGEDQSEFVIKKSRVNRDHDDEDDIKYSDDSEYNHIVKDLDDLESIPNPPNKAKNAFAVTLFCIELAFDSRSRDFLQYAFDLYPDRDYLIVTQPHTVSESTLLQKFTCVDKKIQNTFPHILYIIHRDSLLDIETIVRRATADDIEDIQALTASLDNTKQISDDVYSAIISPESIYQAYVAKILNTVIGVFVMSKDVNLNYYKSHFHIQDSILLPEHDRRGHTRVLHSVVNPIYESNTRF
jgi:hypothetical protein